ncbi:septation protein A [Massilia sp. W12]|uniref:septation protein A n=1 Tax=Massilia sp. W12 TaxID=3126507 RepID=UPI0030CC96D8
MKKFLFDLFPVIVFFVVFNYAEKNVELSQQWVSHYIGFLISDGKVPKEVAPVLLATSVSILASLGQLLWLLGTRQKIDGMFMLSLGIIGVFGGLTIYFHNETFIKWKPTILYWCFGVSMAISQFLFKKNAIRSMMEKEISLPDQVWNRLGLAWMGFFVTLGVLNLLVAFNVQTSTWVSFKTFGMPVLMFVFIIAQSFYLSPYLEPENGGKDGK